MNKIEALKSEKDGLEIKRDIERFAKEGWESISEEDIHRLKWLGLFLRKPTPGYFMLRVRISNGIAFSYQIKALSEIASRFGNGIIDITTRQQVQIRNLKIESIPEVFNLMEKAGLSSMQTGMDNVRNVMGCPLSGLNPKEIADTLPLVKGLTDLFLNNPEFTNLPRKVNIAITGCPDNCVHTESQDLALVPAFLEQPGGKIPGFNVLAGGKLGSGGYRIASSLDIFLEPHEVVNTCAEIVLIYRDHGSRETRTQNRLSFLLDEWGASQFRENLVKHLGHPLRRAGADARNSGHKDHIGIYRQKQLFANAVGLKAVVGRIKAKQLTKVAELAERYGTGEVRFSPSQSLIVPHVPDKHLGDFLEEPILKELLYAPSNVVRNLVSCVGSDYCSLATIETKSRALDLAQKLETRLKDPSPISMHWSGCPAGCGNHLLSDIGFLGKRTKVGGKTVDAVDIFVGGRSGPNPKTSIKILENVPCDALPQVLEGIIPYHTRHKMHPIKKSRPKTSSQNNLSQKPAEPIALSSSA
jgi:ferredoxin-nitrite reductase